MNIDEELERARREGVREEANLPFLLEPGNPNGGAVLLVHGFTASPWEMRTFGEGLAQSGFCSYGLRLPGHGTAPEDLLERRYEEWQEAVAKGLELLSQHHRRVYGLGLSTGALLLCAAAAQKPFEGMALLSPFLRLRHRLAPTAALLKFFHPFQKHPLPEELAPFYYDRRSVAGVHQLGRLARRVRRDLKRIDLPTLVVAAKGDRTIAVRSAQRLHQRLGSAHKELHLYGDEVPHVLTTSENPHWRATLTLCSDFFSRLDSQRQDFGRGPGPCEGSPPRGLNYR